MPTDAIAYRAALISANPEPLNAFARDPKDSGAMNRLTNLLVQLESQLPATTAPTPEMTPDAGASLAVSNLSDTTAITDTLHFSAKHLTNLDEHIRFLTGNLKAATDDSAESKAATDRENALIRVQISALGRFQGYLAKKCPKAEKAESESQTQRESEAPAVRSPTPSAETPSAPQTKNRQAFSLLDLLLQFFRAVSQMVDDFFKWPSFLNTATPPKDTTARDPKAVEPHSPLHGGGAAVAAAPAKKGSTTDELKKDIDLTLRTDEVRPDTSSPDRHEAP